MRFSGTFIASVLASVISAQALGVEIESRGAELTYGGQYGRPDPCAAIAGKKWVAPKEVRACFGSFKVDPTLKSNTLEVVEKTLAFHASTNYQVHAPAPFSSDVREDVIADIARMRRTHYDSELDLHIDLSRALKRLNDGHCVYINSCFDSVYASYVPLPLSLLTDERGVQDIFISPHAFTVASAEFKDQIDVWQNALPFYLKGKLESFAGARVLLINGEDPWKAVEANAKITGGYQGHGTRQTAFFSTYTLGDAGYAWSMGNFASQGLPLTDSVTIMVQRPGHWTIDTITLPYRSRLAVATNFTDSTSYRAQLCVPTAETNGVDAYAAAVQKRDDELTPPPIEPFEVQPKLNPTDRRKYALNVFVDSDIMQNIGLPSELLPANPVNGSAGVAQFFMLDDKKTGVLALGSFSDASYARLQKAMLDGLLNLKAQGATQLIVDITGNGGGYICLAHWLHRILAGPKSSTEPNAGLVTVARVNPLAEEIVKKINTENKDPEGNLLYNPVGWAYPNGTILPASYDWLSPKTEKIINGHRDAFSPRMLDVCQPFEIEPPKEALFDPKKTAIIGNGRCASSCSLFSITMSKLEGAKTVVLGGKQGVKQQYCGVVGGQSTDFSRIDTEIKTVGLKNHTLAPPDFLTNSVQGITWRLGLGIDKPDEPAEWQDHPADYNIPLTKETVNNPPAIWKKVAKTVF